MNEYLIVILIRSRINLAPKIRQTLDCLRLKRRLHARIIRVNPEIEGMLHRIKDYATWGSCDLATLRESIDFTRLEHVRSDDDQLLDAVLRLDPPRKGFGDIHEPFNRATGRGTLGDRGEQIMELVLKMVRPRTEHRSADLRSEDEESSDVDQTEVTDAK